MDVFISWSGERSLKLAKALNEWLPLVVQSVKPWLSTEDINKGARWMAELSQKLEEIEVGILCVTPENMFAPWLLFEAGALSKTLKSSLVCPILYDLNPSDLVGPLSQFQATPATKDEIRRFLGDLVKNSESPLEEQQLDTIFSRLWPDLEEKFKSVGNTPPSETSRVRSGPELLTEVLDRVRSIERQIAAPSEKSINEERLIIETKLKCCQDKLETYSIKLARLHEKSFSLLDKQDATVDLKNYLEQQSEEIRREVCTTHAEIDVLQRQLLSSTPAVWNGPPLPRFSA